MATLTGEVKSFTEPKVLKDLAFAAGGFYGVHVVTRMIPFGPQSGWAMVLKDALVAAGIGYGASKFLGEAAGEAAFTGGGLYTVLDGVGVATHGEYGLNGQIGAPAAPAAKALPGATAATTSSTQAAPSTVAYPQSYIGGGYGM